MENFNYQDVMVLLQITTEDAKNIVGVAMGQPDVVAKDEITKRQLDRVLLLKRLPNTEELIRRRSLVYQSQEQFKKLLRSRTCVKKLAFPKSMRVYTYCLSEETLQACMVSWLHWHSEWFGDVSLEDTVLKHKNKR